MAHLIKYTRKELPHLLKHDERARGEDGEYIRFGNDSIDTSRTHLNYNLHERNDGLSDYEFIKQRAMKYLAKNVRNRADINWAGSWIITLPESLKNASEADKRRFFESVVRFVGDRYGYENLVGAYVHNDETTPHVHIKVTPVFWDKKKKKHRFSAKEKFSIDDLQKFHPELSKHLEREFGYDVGVWADKPNAKSKAPNKTVEELKRETAEAANLKEVVVHETRVAYDELTELKDKKRLIEKEMNEGNIIDKAKRKLVEKDVDEVLLKARELTRERTAELNERTIRAEQRARKAESKRDEAINANKDWSRSYRKLEYEYDALKRENGILSKALNTLQRAFDRAEAFMKRIFGWRQFKSEFREQEPEFYQEFQSVRHDSSLHGKESERDYVQRETSFDLDR